MKTMVSFIMLMCVLNVSHAGPPEIYSQDGQYLGNLSNNPLDVDSVNNPYGTYGNPLNPDSINNEYGRYGNPLSNESVNNPYATEAPQIYGDSPY
jgi:hypothetical protein